MNLYRNDKELVKYKEPSLFNYNIIGAFRGSYRNVLVVFCPTCAEDPELFGEGLFFSDERVVLKGGKPCGCALTPRWEEFQYQVMMKRAASKWGFTFIGWSDQYRGCSTVPRFNCQEHGDFQSINVNDCNRYEINCPGCLKIRMQGRNSKPDQYMINSFLSSECFPEGTAFERSDRLSKNGFREYWNVYCPDCSTNYTSLYKSLANGARGCECSNFRQKYLYLLKIYDGESFLAVKFGIANNYKVRVQSIRCRTSLEVVLYSVWEFSDINSCKVSETYIKHNFNNTVLTKEQLPSGFTETVLPCDLSALENFLDSVAERAIIT